MIRSPKVLLQAMFGAAGRLVVLRELFPSLVVPITRHRLLTIVFHRRAICAAPNLCLYVT